MPEFAPPKLTTRKLLDGDSAHPAAVRLGGVPSWYLFAVGYKSAADILVSRLNDRGVTAEYVCLPILFLYRHYVELSIKALLFDLDELIETIPGIHLDKHPLVPLWSRLRERLDEYTGKTGTDWLDRAEALITELEGLDTTSFTFRYPVDKSGAPVLPPITVNMRHVCEVMAELAMIFEGIGGYLDDHVQMSRELAREAEYGYGY